jgi:hypothetical protein
MRIRTLGIALLPWFFALASASRADTIITREGSSYSGQFLGAKAARSGLRTRAGSDTRSRPQCAVAGLHVCKRHRQMAAEELLTAKTAKEGGSARSEGAHC